MELAWAAGFFDGEGTFAFYKSGRFVASVMQTDPEVLVRFRDAIGIGSLFGPYKTTGLGKKPIYQYRSNGAAVAQQIVALLWPYLCSIKQEQARKSIRLWAAIKPPKRQRNLKGQFL
jgi:hypothetical protein